MKGYIKSSYKNSIFAKIILIIGGIITLFPFVWMISTSLKTGQQVYEMPPKLMVSSPQISNYFEVLRRVPFEKYFSNSVFVSISVTFGTLITSILAAFAFSRIKFFGRDIIFSVFLATMMIPGEVLVIPNYVTLAKLGWINTRLALIAPWMVSVFAVFLMRQYFLGIPESYYYSAKIDGCSDFNYLWRIMVPLAKPAILTIVLLKMIYSWNEFLWPLLVTNTPEMRTLPVGLAVFSTEAGTLYHLLMAASSMIILPILILYFGLSKHIINGAVRSGIKG
ncbi:carbohydrate ABC transporter permease [Clostridium sediminicola]|uniref:carbohydrate ABC transporter permease n=1 Tax=Clostridium sediminicola TaxID=3114879 RepID=UPI0031F1E32F